MGQHIYRNEVLAEFLIKGLVCEKRIVDGAEKEELRLPVRGEAEEGEIDEISESFYPSPLTTLQPNPKHVLSVMQAHFNLQQDFATLPSTNYSAMTTGYVSCDK